MDLQTFSKEASLFILVGNRDGRTQSARVGCCCIWLSGPGFQDLDIWFSGPGFQDLGCCCIWLSGPEFQDLVNFFLLLISLLFFSSLLCPPPLLSPTAAQHSSSRPRSTRAGNQRTTVPIPPVQGTREPAGLLWRTRPGTPHGGPGGWKSKSPGVPGRARSSVCDGPELCHGQTDIVNLYIR